MERISKKKYLLIAIVILLFSMAIVPKEFQNDTFFTIASGQRVLEYGVEKEEKLVWHEGLEFTNPRWLFDVIIAQIYNIGNFTGIYWFVIIITALISLSYFYVLNKFTQKPLTALLCTTITMYNSWIFFAARAQIMSMLLFIIEFYCIEKLIETNKNRYLAILLIIPIILVNTHSSVFPIYFIMFLPYIAEKILRKLLKDLDTDKAIVRNNELNKLFVIMIIAFFIGLFLKPSSIQTYTYIFKNFGGFSSTFISELQPLVLIQFVYVIVLFALLFSVLIFTKVKFRLTDICYILGFFIMSLMARRSLYYFYMISTLCIYRIVSDAIDLYVIKIQEKELTKDDIEMINFIKMIIMTFFVIIIIYLATRVLGYNKDKSFVPEYDFPVNATEYILENINQENMKIYNGFNFGSYLEYKGIKAFIDSRSEVYTEEFNENCTILEDWYNTTRGKINYNETFDKYNITHALIKKDEFIYNFIKYDSKWNLIYEDEYFTIYERNN